MGAHTGKHLAALLTQVLEHHSIANWVFSLTTDNASNNTTLATILEDTIPAWKSDMMHLPYLAHVIQLAVSSLLWNISAEAKNDIIEMNWEDNQWFYIKEIDEAQGFSKTLVKVREIKSCDGFNNYFNDLYLFMNATNIMTDLKASHIYKCKFTESGVISGISRGLWSWSENDSGCAESLEFLFRNIDSG